MTTETYPGAATNTIVGTGPYELGHELTEGAVAPQVRIDGVITDLETSEFTVDPTSGANANVYLTAAAALAYAGGQLILTRRTTIEQGWSGLSAREKGLEIQLDRHAQALQEAQDATGRSLRLATGAMGPVTPEDGKVMVWDEATQTFVNGLSGQDIIDLEAAAAASAAAAAVLVDVAQDAAIDAQTYRNAAEAAAGEAEQSASNIGRRYNSVAAFTADTDYTPINGTIVTASLLVLAYPIQFIKTGETVAGVRAGWKPLGDVTPNHLLDNDVPGTTDMAAAVQGAIDYSASLKARLRFLGQVYATSITIQWKEGARGEGTLAWSGVTFANSELGTSKLRYIGAGGANSCVLNVSRLAVGTEGDALTGNMSNIGLKYLVVDGNELAEFGFYFNRSWSNNDIEFLTATNCLKHGFWAGNCWNGSPRNWHAYKNPGRGISLGINTFGWSQCTVDQSVCTSFFGYYSGYAIDDNASLDPPTSAFNETTGVDEEYGIGIGNSRALVMLNPQANECSGIGIYRAPASLGPLTIIGGYVENNGRSTASTRRWDLWHEPGTSTLGDTIKGMHFGVAGTGAIKIAGSPNLTRREACLKITDSHILPTIDADHNFYRLLDCDRDPVAIVGSKPMQFLGRVGEVMNNTPIGSVVFWVDTGAIMVLRQEGAIIGVTYNGVGDYTLTLSEAQPDSTWIAEAFTPVDNRYVRAADFTTTTCRIYHKSLTNVAADPGASNHGIRIVVYGSLT